jgi:hypothetical protein
MDGRKKMKGKGEERMSENFGCRCIMRNVRVRVRKKKNTMRRGTMRDLLLRKRRKQMNGC